MRDREARAEDAGTINQSSATPCSINCKWTTAVWLWKSKKMMTISGGRTEMEPLPPFVVWDQNRLKVHVWDYHGLDPVCHWVQLKQNGSLIKPSDCSFTAFIN